jgi:protein-L-isoaspartate(D-aspartate) O-methyltransferase
MDFEKARSNMVEQQVRPWDVLDPRVLEVIGDIPREDFTPDQYKKLAYVDTRIPIGHYEEHHCSMANPVIEGRILQEMNVQPDDLVLEIGTGSGYLTACLARLGRHVDTVDINEELTEMAENNLQKLGISNVNFSTGDASKGWSQKRNYDVIVISAAMKRIPESYKKLLKPGGRLFVVTGEAPAMTAYRVTRTGDKEWSVEELFETWIEPIIEPVKQQFIF